MRKRYSDHDLYVIFQTSEGVCCHCGRVLMIDAYGRRRPDNRGWEVEHRNPFSRGGVEDLRNLRASCLECNRAKGPMNTTEFRRSGRGPNPVSPVGDRVRAGIDRLRFGPGDRTVSPSNCDKCGKRLDPYYYQESGRSGWDIIYDEHGKPYLELCNGCIRLLEREGHIR